MEYHAEDDMFIQLHGIALDEDICLGELILCAEEQGFINS